jgi:hypothetical protein
MNRCVIDAVKFVAVGAQTTECTQQCLKVRHKRTLAERVGGGVICPQDDEVTHF